MKKRILSYITTFMMAVTIISAGTVPVSAAVTEGGMAWSYKCPASGSISGVSSPVTAGNYVYLPSGDVLYKFNKNTGKLAAKLTMSGTVGRASCRLRREVAKYLWRLTEASWI